MKREMNLASALHEALKFTDKGRRIKTVDFIHAAAQLGIHMTPAEANYYILHWSGHRFRVIEEGALSAEYLPHGSLD